MGPFASMFNGFTQREFTTAEAATICRLPHQTIIRCFEDGKLRGYRDDRTGLRRINRRELERFMRLCGYR